MGDSAIGCEHSRLSIGFKAVGCLSPWMEYTWMSKSVDGICLIIKFELISLTGVGYR